MAKTITAALVQYRLVTAEKHLLEQTLSGALQVLTEVLNGQRRRLAAPNVHAVTLTS